MFKPLTADQAQPSAQSTEDLELLSAFAFHAAFSAAGALPSMRAGLHHAVCEVTKHDIALEQASEAMKVGDTERAIRSLEEPVIH